MIFLKIQFIFFLLISLFLDNSFAVSEKKLSKAQKNAWKYTQAECRLVCDQKKLPSRQEILGTMALPRHSEPKFETNINCFNPELICANSFSYCDKGKTSKAYIIKDIKSHKKKELKAVCEYNNDSGLIFRVKIPSGLFTGTGYFWIDKLHYEGSEFYSKDRHYYKAVSGE